MRNVIGTLFFVSGCNADQRCVLRYKRTVTEEYKRVPPEIVFAVGLKPISVGGRL